MESRWRKARRGTNRGSPWLVFFFPLCSHPSLIFIFIPSSSFLSFSLSLSLSLSSLFFSPPVSRDRYPDKSPSLQLQSLCIFPNHELIIQPCAEAVQCPGAGSRKVSDGRRHERGPSRYSIHHREQQTLPPTSHRAGQKNGQLSLFSGTSQEICLVRHGGTRFMRASVQAKTESAASSSYFPSC